MHWPRAGGDWDATWRRSSRRLGDGRMCHRDPATRRRGEISTEPTGAVGEWPGGGGERRRGSGRNGLRGRASGGGDGGDSQRCARSRAARTGAAAGRLGLAVGRVRARWNEGGGRRCAGGSDSSTRGHTGDRARLCAVSGDDPGALRRGVGAAELCYERARADAPGPRAGTGSFYAGPRVAAPVTARTCRVRAETRARGSRTHG